MPSTEKWLEGLESKEVSYPESKLSFTTRCIKKGDYLFCTRPVARTCEYLMPNIRKDSESLSLWWMHRSASSYGSESCVVVTLVKNFCLLSLHTREETFSLLLFIVVFYVEERILLVLEGIKDREMESNGWIVCWCSLCSCSSLFSGSFLLMLFSSRRFWYYSYTRSIFSNGGTESADGDGKSQVKVTERNAREQAQRAENSSGNTTITQFLSIFSSLALLTVLYLLVVTCKWAATISRVCTYLFYQQPR